ncbi:MAG: DUF21 domain-containing protein [Acidobacteria bacterium]|nr:DUF21 domain-containing protein [Acidobacteriota bacterium]
MAPLVILLVLVGAALSISFLCSILEAGLLSVRISRLIELKDTGSRGAGMLLNLKQHRIDDAISAILTLNTIAHTVGAAMAGAQAAVVFGDRWVGVFSGVLTLLILVITEIIPKTLGTVHATRLAPYVGMTTQLLVTVMSPLLVITRALTRILSRSSRKAVTSGELNAMVALAAREGTLSAYQSQALANLLAFESIKLDDVMTPRPVVSMLPLSSTVAEFVAHPALKTFSRIPLFDQNIDDVKGYVLVREVLQSVAMGGRSDRGVLRFLRPIRFLPKRFTVGAALKSLLAERDHMAIVVDEYGGVSGLVTLEDLFETILGVEIVDESDQIADLQEKAQELRERRLARIKAMEASEEAS